MAIEFSCPACGGTLRVEESTAGRLVRCGGCMTMLRVPDAPPPSATASGMEPETLSPDDESIPTATLDDEPRRPRRRRWRPPQPKGRGPVFWILMTFGVIGVGSCACCGGVFLLLPGPNWRTHESRQGGFKVELPATPRKDMPMRGVKPDASMKVEGTILWSRGEEYVVVYGEILPRNQRQNPDERLMKEAVNGIETDPDCRRIVRNESVTVSGFPAREIEFLANDGGTYLARIVVADSRFYILVGGGRFVRPGNANIRRFLNSFEVTDPKLQGEAKQ